MSLSQFESVLKFFNSSIEEICNRSGIEESHFYRLLSHSVEPDSYTLEKLSKVLCVSQNEILRLLKLSPKRSDNVVLYPAFSSFYEPIYIFKMCAFKEVQGISLNKYLSFCAIDELKVEYRLLQGELTIYDSRNVNIYINDCIINIPFDFDQEEYIADMTKSSVLKITISLKK